MLYIFRKKYVNFVWFVRARTQSIYFKLSTPSKNSVRHSEGNAYTLIQLLFSDVKMDVFVLTCSLCALSNVLSAFTITLTYNSTNNLEDIYYFSHFILFFILTLGHFFIAFRERDRERRREREKCWCERQTSIGCFLYVP